MDKLDYIECLWVPCLTVMNLGVTNREIVVLCLIVFDVNNLIALIHALECCTASKFNVSIHWFVFV